MGPEAPSDPKRKRMSREESRARTRARVLEAAAAVFAERGFYGASVEEIAERAGFSRGAVYSNFEGKEDLFLAVLDAHLEAEAEAAGAAWEGVAPEQVLAVLRAQAARRAAGARQWALLWAEFWLHVLRHPDLAPKLAARQRARRSVVARMVEDRCRQLGIPLRVPAEHLASLLVAVDDGLVLQEHLEPGALPDGLRAAAAVLLVGGMVASGEVETLLTEAGAS